METSEKDIVASDQQPLDPEYEEEEELVDLGDGIMISAEELEMWNNLSDTREPDWERYNVFDLSDEI